MPRIRFNRFSGDMCGGKTPSGERDARPSRRPSRAKSGAIQLYELRKRYNGKALPRVEILDLREEIRKDTVAKIENAKNEG